MSLATLKTKVEQLIEKAQNGGVESEIITITASAENPVNCCDIFRTFVDGEKDIVVFRIINDEATWVQDQCVVVLVSKNVNIGVLRKRKTLQGVPIQSQYAAMINVGDQYEKIKVGEWFNGV